MKNSVFLFLILFCACNKPPKKRDIFPAYFLGSWQEVRSTLLEYNENTVTYSEVTINSDTTPLTKYTFSIKGDAIISKIIYPQNFQEISLSDWSRWDDNDFFIGRNSYKVTINNDNSFTLMDYTEYHYSLGGSVVKREIERIK